MDALKYLEVWVLDVQALASFPATEPANASLLRPPADLRRRKAKKCLTRALAWRYVKAGPDLSRADDLNVRGVYNLLVRVDAVGVEALAFTGRCNDRSRPPCRCSPVGL